jgi:cysteinyl-tRNA synthetase
MNSLKITDSLSENKEILEPLGKKPVRLFVCGPTVYDYLHIGNARTYLTFDAFVKFLHSQQIKVFYLQNITDIDDKIIARAAEEGISPETLAKKFTRIYLANMKALGVTAVDIYAPATKFISQIVQQVEKLIEKGYAYKIEGDGYYFDISSFADYGKLAHRTVSQAEDGVTRIDESIGKKNKGDFCVWKFSKSGEPTWNTKLGAGRPGWHIEDTAISEKFFGPQYDIHGGGVDLKFPHHEAEIAQQESASGKKPFVKIWMHVGALTVDGKKMSKSLQNFITIDGFLAKYKPEILRFMTLTHHYRSPLNYTETAVEDAVSAWSGILAFLAKLEFVARNSKVKSKDPDRIQKETSAAEKRFLEGLYDDFNTPIALATLFDIITKNQPSVWTLAPKEAKLLSKFLTTSLKTLGFSPILGKTPRKIEIIAKKREVFRLSKQFMQADALRNDADALGYVIEDTPLGPFIAPKA